MRPFLTQNNDGTPFLAMSSYTNLGQVDIQGVDFGFRWQSPGGWSLGLTTRSFHAGSSPRMPWMVAAVPQTMSAR